MVVDAVNVAVVVEVNGLRRGTGTLNPNAVLPARSVA
jgi:hypothetical protein